MGQLWTRRNLAAVVVMAVTTLSGCTATLKPNTDPSIGDFITGVSDGSGTVQAVLVDGTAPLSSGGPSASVAGVAVMINGGSSQQTLASGSAFTRVIVSVAGFQDYYELTLPAGTTSEGILLSANPNAFATNLQFQYAVADAQGVGAYAYQSVRFLRVGTGDIQISVAWTDTADVDLHVIDPNGEEIYFSHPDAASGGTLDLDGNAACQMNRLADNSLAWVSNENVVWPTTTAIPGTYRVILHYYAECGVTKTDWVVTIQRTGAAPQIHVGAFSGPAVGLTPDTVAVFDY